MISECRACDKIFRLDLVSTAVPAFVCRPTGGDVKGHQASVRAGRARVGEKQVGPKP